MSGWGSGAWGSTPWGSGEDAPRLLSATALRENLVRLTFDTVVLYDRTGSPRDGSRRSLYAVTPVAGTAGFDGEAARPVLVGRADRGGEGGAQIDLWLDRALTHFPARYLAIAHGVYGASGVPIDPTATSASFLGVRAGKAPRDASTGALAIGADIALPQTEAAALAARASGALLGSYAVDATGDFAFDQGVQSLTKRILRRLFSEPGAYAHLGATYGAGLRGLVKKLATPNARAEIQRVAAQQAKAEPEVADASAALRQVSAGAWELRLSVRTRFAQEFSIPVPLAA